MPPKSPLATSDLGDVKGGEEVGVRSRAAWLGFLQFFRKTESKKPLLGFSKQCNGVSLLAHPL